jgi:hypothetical protein
VGALLGDLIGLGMSTIYHRPPRWAAEDRAAKLGGVAAFAGTGTMIASVAGSALFWLSLQGSFAAAGAASHLELSAQEHSKLTQNLASGAALGGAVLPFAEVGDIGQAILEGEKTTGSTWTTTPGLLESLK